MQYISTASVILETGPDERLDLLMLGIKLYDIQWKSSTKTLWNPAPI